jgi:hypothetical protein
MIRTMIPALPKQTPAFTRLELLACLAALALWVTIIGPALANSASRSDRVVCFNNLRQIGVGYAQFGLEHGDQTAWQLPMAEGGNRDYLGKNEAFMQFAVLSNYIASPKVLMDPADDRALSVRVAASWDNHPQGGLLNSAFKNNAVSYFLGLDGNFSTPRLLLSGDRNLNHMGISSCSSGVAPAATLWRMPQTTSWTNGIHGLSGNLLLYDGNVHQLDAHALRAVIPGQMSDSPRIYHILLPF